MKANRYSIILFSCRHNISAEQSATFLKSQLDFFYFNYLFDNRAFILIFNIYSVCCSFSSELPSVFPSACGLWSMSAVACIGLTAWTEDWGEWWKQLVWWWKRFISMTTKSRWLPLTILYPGHLLACRAITPFRGLHDNASPFSRGLKQRQLWIPGRHKWKLEVNFFFSACSGMSASSCKRKRKPFLFAK